MTVPQCPEEPDETRFVGISVTRTPRRLPVLIASLAVASGGTAVAGAGTALMVDFPDPRGRSSAATVPGGAAGPGGSGGPGGPGGGSGPAAPAPFGRVVPPDVLVVATRPVGGAELARIRRLDRVRDVITVDAGQVRLGGRVTNAFGIDPVRFRSWTPPGTASRDQLWSALARDHFVVNESAGKSLRLRTGTPYPIVAKTSPYVTMGGSASLGVPGVDMLVSRRTGDQIGLVRDLGVMINAPGARMGELTRELRSIFGRRSQVLNLHDRKNLPGGVPRGKPRTYLELYKKSAATCPGLSWTVLAAMGQIESSHGRNTGPSSAGARGPMQFLPSTWRSYGLDGDRDGRADIMNPYDAVPSAAKYLCGYGAGQGGRKLSYAIWQYNHSNDYVNSVLGLARAYARTY
jgi:hypothetical protein